MYRGNTSFLSEANATRLRLVSLNSLTIVLSLPLGRISSGINSRRPSELLPLAHFTPINHYRLISWSLEAHARIQIAVVQHLIILVSSLHNHILDQTETLRKELVAQRQQNAHLTKMVYALCEYTLPPAKRQRLPDCPCTCQLLTLLFVVGHRCTRDCKHKFVCFNNSKHNFLEFVFSVVRTVNVSRLLCYSTPTPGSKCFSSFRFVPPQSLPQRTSKL